MPSEGPGHLQRPLRIGIEISDRDRVAGKQQVQGWARRRRHDEPPRSRAHHQTTHLIAFVPVHHQMVAQPQRVLDRERAHGRGGGHRGHRLGALGSASASGHDGGDIVGGGGFDRANEHPSGGLHVLLDLLTIGHVNTEWQRSADVRCVAQTGAGMSQQ